jgi:AraC family transcriptional regulator
MSFLECRYLLTILRTSLIHHPRETHQMNSTGLAKCEPHQSLLVSAEAFAEQPLPGCRRPFSAKAIEILDDVRRAMERNPESAHAAALRLVTLLTPSAQAADTRGGLAPWQKRKIDRYLKEKLEQTIYVEDLASHVSLSVSHFCRAFKESFGTTPHMHIIRLRLELAQRLMLTTEEPLSQIALACGMADQAHLSKLFRRGVGESPGAWRRRSLTDAEAEARCRRLKESHPANTVIGGNSRQSWPSTTSVQTAG